MPLCIFDSRKPPAKSRPTYAKLTDAQKSFEILEKLNFEGYDRDTNFILGRWPRGPLNVLELLAGHNNILDYAPMQVDTRNPTSQVSDNICEDYTC